jgi:hypothetical protein
MFEMATPLRMEQLQIKVGLPLIGSNQWRHRNAQLVCTRPGTTKYLLNRRHQTAALPDPIVDLDKECALL